MEPLNEEEKEDKVNKIRELVENGEAGKANWIYKIQRLKALWNIGDTLSEINDLLFLE